MKQEFNIKVSIEQIENKIVTEFECSPKKYKDGDIVLVNWDYAHDAPAILKDYNMGSCHVAIATDKDNIPIYNHSITNTNIICYATPHEKQLLFDALEKAGKRWNAETLQIEDLKVEPKVGDYVKLIYGDEEDCIYCRILSINSKQIVSKSSFAPKENRLDCRSFCNYSTYRILTEAQFQSEVNSLGFEYDFKNNTFNELRWEPKEGERCFELSIFLNELCVVEILYDSRYHKKSYDEGRTFKTRLECESAIEKIKEILKSK